MRAFLEVMLIPRVLPLLALPLLPARRAGAWAADTQLWRCRGCLRCAQVRVQAQRRRTAAGTTAGLQDASHFIALLCVCCQNAMLNMTSYSCLCGHNGPASARMALGFVGNMLNVRPMHAGQLALVCKRMHGAEFRSRRSCGGWPLVGLCSLATGVTLTSHGSAAHEQGWRGLFANCLMSCVCLDCTQVVQFDPSALLLPAGQLALETKQFRLLAFSHPGWQAEYR